ncbi:MAG: DUF2203 family protein [Bacilli bacterium]
MTKQYYTVEDANRLLPQIRTQIAELKNSREEIAVRRLKIERLRREQGEAENSDHLFEEEAHIEFSLLTARQQIDHLLSQSIEVKDIDAGLVDFLTLIDGREAYLCWRAGEPDIRYWHGIEEGFAGRRRFTGESS